MQGKELRVAKKRAIGRYPEAFRKMAVERLKGCENVLALARELGVHQRLLYKWRDRLEPIDDAASGPPRAAADSGACRSAFRGDGDHDSGMMPIRIPR